MKKQRIFTKKHFAPLLVLVAAFLLLAVPKVNAAAASKKPGAVTGFTAKSNYDYDAGGIKLKWKKVKCDKYEIRYSQKKNMKKSKKVTCGKNKTSLVIKKLKKNRKYYVQIRTKAGKKYSAWSKVKTISKR